jgi:hydroxypyruvate isomerase
MPVSPAGLPGSGPSPMRFSANVSFLFGDLRFLERFAREHLAWAAEQARSQGASIMIEAINSYENGPYLLDTTAKAVGLLDAVAADNVLIEGCDV